MLKLTIQDVQLQQVAKQKTTAIQQLARDLANKGLVDAGYVDGMLSRESQHSTFLGNGIAIPHGTTDTRDLVNTTGVVVHHFPQGVDWGDNNTVYIAIGIAAKSDEHLGILKQLTKVLSSEGVEDKLKQASSAQDIVALLNGDVQFDVHFNDQLIQTEFPANDITQLIAVAAGLIQNNHAAEADFASHLVSQQPTYLGDGLWMVSSTESVTKTSLSIVSTKADIRFNNNPVKTLMAFAVCNAAHKNVLAILSELIFNQQQSKITTGTNHDLVTLFTQDQVEEQSKEDEETATFTIKNAHGLHARPGAMLVAEAKKFESIIKVKNLDGQNTMVNAKSLMKVIAMGVKHGHQLEFSAIGTDATQALASIGSAIESGLGEG